MLHLHAHTWKTGGKSSRLAGLLRRQQTQGERLAECWHRAKRSILVFTAMSVTLDTGWISSNNLLCTSSHKYLLSVYQVHTLLGVIKRFGTSIGLKKSQQYTYVHSYNHVASRS